MIGDLSRVSSAMQDVAGIIGRLSETSGDDVNEEKCNKRLSIAVAAYGYFVPIHAAGSM